MSTQLILATDLDGTMADGSAEARAELLELLRQDPGARMIYVTGRTPEAARELMARVGLPAPDVLIADVGTTVLRGAGPAPVVEIEAELDRRWPGNDVVGERLVRVRALEPQQIDAPRRISYWIEPVRRLRSEPPRQDPFAARAPEDATLSEQAAEVAAGVVREAIEALAPLAVDVIASANVFLDVLPHGVNKGTTLRRVLQWMGAEEAHCVVAGDSLNDLALFETGLRGIVVGNCEPALRRRVAGMQRVYHAHGVGASGVLEGLRHHGHFRGVRQGGESHGE